MATLIHNVTELQAMSADLTADYELANDIDASATVGWNAGAGFIPIGDSVSKFTGTFDGKGYTILDLFINRPTSSSVGLFGYWEGVSVSNVTFTGADITGKNNVGTLIGYAYNGTITNCDSLDVDIYGRAYVGGLVGDAYLTDITDCHSSGTIEGDSPLDYGGLIGSFGYGTVEDCSSSCTVTTTYGEEAGGLVGYTWGDPDDTFFRRCYATGDVTASHWSGGFVGGVGGYFEDCWASGNVILLDYGMGGGFMGMGAWGGGYPQFKRCYATGNITAAGDAGGFVGWLRGDDIDHYAIVEQCFATGDVIPVGNETYGMGGFVGDTDDYVTIRNCYARSNVEGFDSVGGFCGYINPNNSFENCYSTGYVTGTSLVGGFLGDIYGSPSITACFWDTETSGQGSSAGGTGKTTAQMKAKATFSGWDFSSIWSITGFCNNGYPCLQNVTPNCALIPSIQGPQVREIIALEAIRNIEMSCMGRAYVDEEGNLTYESRYARNP